MAKTITIKCESCQGTGKSSYGQEFWEEHTCGKCNGTGKVKVK